MIVIYPMLISKAVSENIVPGLTKTIEAYIIANAKDIIITNPEVKRNFNFKIKGKQIIRREDVDLSEGEDELFGGTRTKPHEEKKRKEWSSEEEKREAEHERKENEEKRKAIKHAADIKDREKKQKEEEEEKAKQKKIDDAKKASASVKIQDNRALSIEPSFIEIETINKLGNTIKESFGVKVIPFRVKSDAKLSRLILHDIKMKNFNAIMISFGRKITKVVWKFLDKWSSAGKLGGLTPSGDPRRDIIMARTGHQGEGFIVLSKTEDIDETFLNNVSKINRLFKMGWGNIIITDDINRTAYFCMKQFKGVCTAVSYGMIYQNFGVLKVYQDLEDAKRQSSSIFKIRKPLSKIIAEWVAEHRQVKYLSEDK